MIKRFLFSKKGIILTSIIFVLFVIFVLPYFARLTAEKTNSNFSPDTGFFYSLEEFYNNMEIYGIEGRNFYILMRWTFDIVWPIVYFCFYLSTLGYLAKKLEKKQQILFFALPVFGVGFDFLENLLATINVSLYPNRAEFLLRLLQVSSLFKWAFIILSTFSILYLLFFNLAKKKNINSNLVN